jgi:L-alanine-DL-glutamate epimerase-like enolase superfamily enzyme
MRIVEVKLFRVDLPLADPFQHASSGLINTLQEVVASVKTDTGLIGYGEVRGNCTYVTGDTPDRVIAAASFLAPLLIGEPLEDLGPLLERMERAIVGNSAAKALLDIALHDALARVLGVSVATLLGGRRSDLLPTDDSVAFAAPEETAKRARSSIREGYRVIKVRVGLSLEKDEARLTAVREVIDDEPEGSEVTLAADANGTWQPKEAIGYLRRWEKYRLGWIEQPVGADMIDGLRLVRENVAIPVMADESAKGPKEVLRLIEERAVDMLHFKLIKAGGFVPLRAMEAIAEAAGIPYMIGQMDEGMLATAAAVHAGAASQAWFFEIHGYKRVKFQPFRGLEIRRGAMVVPKVPGLGVEVDETALSCVHVVGEKG